MHCPGRSPWVLGGSRLETDEDRMSYWDNRLWAARGPRPGAEVAAKRAREELPAYSLRSAFGISAPRSFSSLQSARYAGSFSGLILASSPEARLIWDWPNRDLLSDL